MAKTCQFCGETFTNTPAYIRHQVRQHGNPMPNEQSGEDMSMEVNESQPAQQTHYMEALYTMLEQIDNSQELQDLINTYGLSNDSYIQDLLFNLKWKEMQNPPAPQTYQSNQSTEIIDLTGDEEPPNKHPALQSPLPGPNTLQDGGNDDPYEFRQVRQRTYAKNAAVDTTFKVKFNDQWQGDKLVDILEELDNMFGHILQEAREGRADNDLGRVIIHHDTLDNPIVVPLCPLEDLNASTIMQAIENVLNSHEELDVNDSFDITVGVIEMPKGAGGPRRRITNLQGPNNSIHRKGSMVEIINKDQICMARAICVAWARQCIISQEEWQSFISDDTNNRPIYELVLDYGKVPRSFYYNLINKNRQEQKKMADLLCQRANVPTDRPASIHEITNFENVLNVQICVMSARCGNKMYRLGTCKQQKLYLYLVDSEDSTDEDLGHFHAITSMTGFLSVDKYCDKCHKGYKCGKANKHNCEVCCLVCKRQNCIMTQELVCEDCNMTCRNRTCYEVHKEKKKGISQCERWFKCPTCKKVIDRNERRPEDHRCGDYKCQCCSVYVTDPHQCYQRAAKPIAKQGGHKFIFFDFECRQDEMTQCEQGYLPRNKCDTCQPKKTCKKCRKCRNCNTASCGKNSHSPNYVIAQKVCDHCLQDPFDPSSKCDSCGTRCTTCWDKDKKRPSCETTCGFREIIFQGDETLQRFGEWLFQEQHQNVMAIAHNLKGYDGMFIMEYLINQSIRPAKVILNGTKLMYLNVQKSLNITLIDSYNHLPQRLSSLPKAFGLQELKKGWFPHFFNTKDNQNYEGPMPDPEYYGVDYMGKDDRTQFLKWHTSQQNIIFDFRAEMETYCRSDVCILREACMKYRDLLLSVTSDIVEDPSGKPMYQGGVDAFDHVTIASTSMKIFKQRFLEEEHSVQLIHTQGQLSNWCMGRKKANKWTVLYEGFWLNEEQLKDRGWSVKCSKFLNSPIAHVPNEGYVKKDQYSKVSIQWLEWIAVHDGICIQHALNAGEYRVPNSNYKLDGFCEATNTVYEFHGCLYHGCTMCYPVERQSTKHPRTNQSIEELYTMTMKKKAYLESVGYKYVCIWEHEFQDQLKENAEMKTFVDNLDVQDRLNPRDSFAGGRTNATKLHYKVKNDETIKYADVCSLYPNCLKNQRYPRGHPEIITSNFDPTLQSYFGMAKVKILSPRNLYHPVLFYKSGGKLKFPLCRTCADNESQQPCVCSDEQRAMTGTWCTPELMKALGKGYRLLKIYEVYHFPQTMRYNPDTKEGGLFTEYVNTFLRLKQEASGYPDSCQTEEDKLQYIKDYEAKEGVKLDPDRVQKNPALRSIAKLAANSQWGKYAEATGKTQTSFIHDSNIDEFYRLLTDPSVDIRDFHILTDDMVQMEWVHQPDFVPDNLHTNIFIATFTTCWARLKLYSYLEKLDKNVLYFDTDSIIYISRPGGYSPSLGPYLGDLTNELQPDEFIVEFVSGGPKNYAYHTNKGLEVCKVRGFTLNYKNSKLVNFQAIKDLVTGQSHKPIVITNPSKICRDKLKRKLYNRVEDKKYNLVYTKRRIVNNYDTEPYGY